MCAASSKFRSVKLVRGWGNIALHRDMFPKGTLMNTDLLRILSSWPDSLGDTVIAGLQHCSKKQFGPSAMAVLNGSGDERG